MTNATAAAAKCSHFPPVAQPHPSIYYNLNSTHNDLKKKSCTDLCQAILMLLKKCLTHDPLLLIINRACFLSVLLKPSRQIPVMVVRVYSLIYFLQDFQQVAIMVWLARETRQGDPIKLEILPDKFIGPSFGGQHPGANLGWCLCNHLCRSWIGGNKFKLVEVSVAPA